MNLAKLALSSSRHARLVFLRVPLLVSLAALTGPGVTSAATVEYKVLATSKTSTMQKELNEAGALGYRFAAVMGGGTLGGSEVVVAVAKDPKGGKFSYKLLATSKTSTMQKEMQDTADEGYEYVGQSVFSSAFGGAEVVVIMGRADGATEARHSYRLLATKKTSTMEKELKEAGSEGFDLLGFTVSKTAFGGEEILSILRKPAGK